MIEINLENMKDVSVKNVLGKCEIELINCTGEIIRIITTIQNGEAIHDGLEKITIAPEYWYENMQEEQDNLQIKVEELEEQLTSALCCEMII